MVPQDFYLRLRSAGKIGSGMVAFAPQRHKRRSPRDLRILARSARFTAGLTQDYETLTAVREKLGYIPTLDGWRAIAITGVIFAHSRQGIVPWLGPRWGFYLWAMGGHGVDLFFAISGLLITSRLLDEEKKFGRISLRGFYVRRAFRILPPAILYLAVVGLLSLIGVLTISKLDWFASLFFFRNYTVILTPPNMHWWFTSHFWSLSVEEHFYLLLPSVLLFMKNRRLTALGIMILLVELCKFVLLHGLHVDRDIFRFHTEICFDMLLIPAFVAVWIQRGSNQTLIRRMLPPWSFFVLLPLYFYLLREHALSPLPACVAPLLLLSTVYNPGMFIGRILESAPLRWIGRLSYSIYLWQMLFVCSRSSEPPPLGILQRSPLNILLVAVCAAASFYLIELPTMRLGHRLAKPATPGHKDVAVTS